MLRPVKDQYLSRRTLGGNQIGVLGHVPRLVDFSGVNYLLDGLDFGRSGDGMATHFSPFVVPIEVGIAFGEVDCCDLKVIWGLVGGVGTEQKSVDRIGFVCGPGRWSRCTERDSKGVLTIPCRGTIDKSRWANPAHG